ncbi:CBS domain-containing protein [Streptomyces sp. H10-C2]|uniref:CBS domain-containing protein n=1 Tax=unclassified Streptomyces TaxID=2593676 RepID=UPI0024B92386|nr:MULTISPECIES: CBS domain-containing protein [unclassified Streptomyces]MDJ0345838.1 CBS domain-containing protein [Streptomyces sp. PH10-H1]MDJ0371196.1 CBS domain-containing protein [Streptomyces sp. H10-C2]
MKHNRISDVMTSDVVKAVYGTPFKVVAERLSRHRISGLPVVDGDDKVIGVISESDLMTRQAAVAEDGHQSRWPRISRSARKELAKARALTAGQLMSQPAVTAHAEDSIAEAARIMAQHRVERMPVIDEQDRLVGIVTRRDLLQVFLRPDAELRREVIDEVLVRTLWLAPEIIGVSARDGLVTLEGRLDRRSEAGIAVHLTRQTDGVVAVIDKLTYRLDDSHIQPTEQAMHGVADDLMRKL